MGQKLNLSKLLLRMQLRKYTLKLKAKFSNITVFLSLATPNSSKQWCVFQMQNSGAVIRIHIHVIAMKLSSMCRYLCPCVYGLYLTWLHTHIYNVGGSISSCCCFVQQLNIYIYVFSGELF